MGHRNAKRVKALSSAGKSGIQGRVCEEPQIGAALAPPICDWGPEVEGRMLVAAEPWATPLPNMPHSSFLRMKCRADRLDTLVTVLSILTIREPRKGCLSTRQRRVN